MADLYQFRNNVEGPLDCLYILRCTGDDPLGRLELEAKEKRALKQKAKALGPRGQEGELISGECPIDMAHRVTFVGLGEENELSHSKLRSGLQRVMKQATKNREYQIGLAIAVRAHGMTDSESRLFALREAAVCDYTFDHFKSKKNEFDKIDGIHFIPLAGETEEELSERLKTFACIVSRSTSPAISPTGRATISRQRRWPRPPATWPTRSATSASPSWV